MVFELIIALAQSFCIMRGGRFSLFGPDKEKSEAS